MTDLALFVPPCAAPPPRSAAQGLRAAGRPGGARSGRRCCPARRARLCVWVFAKPALAHPLGGNEGGQDPLARILTSGRISLAIRLITAAVATAIATVLAIAAAGQGGPWDVIAMRVVDAVVALPFRSCSRPFFGAFLTVRIALPCLVLWTQPMRKLEAPKHGMREGAGAPVLKTGDLVVTYRAGLAGGLRGAAQVDALAGVTLEVRAGEVVGLVGGSGSGKTALARVALGIVTPSGGTVALAGAPPRPGGRRRWCSRIPTGDASGDERRRRAGPDAAALEGGPPGATGRPSGQRQRIAGQTRRSGTAAARRGAHLIAGPATPDGPARDARGGLGRRRAGYPLIHDLALPFCDHIAVLEATRT